MPFKKGQSGNPNGKPPGPNKMTRAAREAFQFAFDEIGGAEELAVWGKTNRTEFYKLFARLIPVQVANAPGETFKTALERIIVDPHDPDRESVQAPPLQ